MRLTLGWGAVELLPLLVVVVVVGCGGGGGLMTMWAFVGRLFENHQKLLLQNSTEIFK